MSGYILFTIPWSESEPKDEYEDTSAICIRGFYYSKEAAFLAAKNVANTAKAVGDIKVVREMSSEEPYEYAWYLSKKDEKDQELNTLEGFALVLREVIINA